MIKFDAKSKTFYLEGEDFSYVFKINVHGYPESLYYGKKIDSGSDLSYLAVRRERGFAACYSGSEDRNDSPDSISSEFSCYGAGDFRLSAVLSVDALGNRVERLRYKSHKLVKTKPNVLPMPVLRGGDGKDGVETLILTLYSTNLEVDLYYTVYPLFNALTRRTVVKNTSKSKVEIKRLASFFVDFHSSDFDFITLWGKHCGERHIERSPLRRGIQSVQSLRGSSSHHFNPFMALCEKTATEHSGEAYGFNLVYGGSFLMQAELSQTDTTRIFSGFSETDFSWSLNSSESLSTPETVAVYSSCGLGGMSRSFHDLYRKHLINPDFSYKARPIVINNWESTYFDFDNEKICKLIDDAKPLGIDTFVMDDGWFAKRNGDRSSLGDWYVNTDKLKGGLTTIINHCKKSVMKFGLWFEPEMISPDSDLFRAHPEYALKGITGEYSTSRSQLVLDLSNNEVVEYLKKTLSKILSENDISYVKWDYNRNITDAYSPALPADRQQEFWHRYMLGLYELLRFLTEEFPHVLFEGCSGGGGRFDPSMLYYFPQTWTSDNSDAFARTKIQYGTSLVYPLSSMTGHVSVCPNHQTGRITPLDSRAIIASNCSYGYELNVGAMTDEEREIVTYWTNNYHSLSPLILGGDLYRLLSPFETTDFAFLVINKEKSEGILSYMHGLNECCPAVQRLKLYGLDPSKTYKLTALNSSTRYPSRHTPVIQKGSTLINAGLPLPTFWTDMCAIMYKIEEVH